DGVGNLTGNTVLYRAPRGRGTLNEFQLKKIDLGRELLAFHDPVRASLDALTVPLPNKTVSALESWQVERMMVVETPDEIGKKVRVAFTYTYLGQRNRNGKDEAVIRVSGVVRDPVLGGKASGTALVDLASGQVSLASVQVAIELPGLRLDL